MIKPTTIRFTNQEDDLIDKLQDKTQLPRADVVRRLVRFAGPKFLSGDANIFDLSEEKKTTKKKAA